MTKLFRVFFTTGIPYLLCLCAYSTWTYYIEALVDVRKNDTDTLPKTSYKFFKHSKHESIRMSRQQSH